MGKETESRRVRGFTQASRAWYFRAAHPSGREDFTIGVYLVDPDDGCEYEFGIRMTDIGVWRLEVFSDAWQLLGTEFADLIAWLATAPENATADRIRAGLAGLGIEDLTVTNAPLGTPPPRCRECGQPVPTAPTAPTKNPR